MNSDLNERLERHKKWLCGKLGGERLVLPNADLQGTNLQDANLQTANLEKANLEKANLQGANLQGAYLQRATLQGATLQGADLRWANLQVAYLRGANLQGANLRWANLEGAHLRDANLDEAKLPDFQKMTDSELVIGWKKISDGIILMLEITGQRTCTLTSKVCRCSEAKVLEAFTSEGTQVQGITTFRSLYDNSFLYELGKVVRVPDYDGDIRVPGAPGIHFFLTRKEAENYYR